MPATSPRRHITATILNGQNSLRLPFVTVSPTTDGFSCNGHARLSVSVRSVRECCSHSGGIQAMADEESMQQDLPPSAGLDTSVPSVARGYDAIMGGKDNFAVDRAIADEWRKVIPQAPELIKEARRFQHRTVRFMVHEGIRQ